MFKGIIGNEQIQEELMKAVQNNTISHSYMFIGNEGIGKQQIAKQFAKMILCTENDKDSNKCKSCIEFDSNNNPDFLYIEPEGNSIKIEQIRYLQTKIQEKPIISNKKVYIINDANKMTTEAQNCLLKTLEEPPEYSTIILIGSNSNAFLNTIKSRCMMLIFRPIDDELIKEYLQKNYNIENIDSNVLKTFQGSIGKAIALKDKTEQYRQVQNIIQNLNKKNIVEIISMSEILYKNKDDIENILEYINLTLLNLTKEEIKYVNCINIVEDTKKRLNQNANYDMCIDNMLFNMWEEVN